MAALKSLACAISPYLDGLSSSLSADLNLIDKESDDVLERIMDEKTASESKILHGHSGPVYGVSFSPDRCRSDQPF